MIFFGVDSMPVKQIEKKFRSFTELISILGIKCSRNSSQDPRNYTICNVSFGRKQELPYAL